MSTKENNRPAQECTAQLLGVLALCVVLSVGGEEGARSESVRIHAPAAGALLDGETRHALEYEIKPGAGSHHVHLYVDDIEVAILRRLKGSHLLELKRGPHEICVKAVNAKHVPIGAESCIHVSVR